MKLIIKFFLKNVRLCTEKELKFNKKNFYDVIKFEIKLVFTKVTKLYNELIACTAILLTKS
jgi:hypothetical protein